MGGACRQPGVPSPLPGASPHILGFSDSSQGAPFSPTVTRRKWGSGQWPGWAVTRTWDSGYLAPPLACAASVSLLTGGRPHPRDPAPETHSFICSNWALCVLFLLLILTEVQCAQEKVYKSLRTRSLKLVSMPMDHPAVKAQNILETPRTPSSDHLLTPVALKFTLSLSCLFLNFTDGEHHSRCEGRVRLLSAVPAGPVVPLGRLARSSRWQRASCSGCVCCGCRVCGVVPRLGMLM